MPSPSRSSPPRLEDLAAGKRDALDAGRTCGRDYAASCIAFSSEDASGRVRDVVDLHEFGHLGQPALLHKGHVVRVNVVKGIRGLVVELHREAEGVVVLRAGLAQALKLLHTLDAGGSQAAWRKSRSAAGLARARRKTTVWRIMAERTADGWKAKN